MPYFDVVSGDIDTVLVKFILENWYKFFSTATATCFTIRYLNNFRYQARLQENLGNAELQSLAQETLF
jgi:hypothetical protein